MHWPHVTTLRRRTSVRATTSYGYLLRPECTLGGGSLHRSACPPHPHMIGRGLAVLSSWTLTAPSSFRASQAAYPCALLRGAARLWRSLHTVINDRCYGYTALLSGYQATGQRVDIALATAATLRRAFRQQDQLRRICKCGASRRVFGVP